MELKRITFSIDSKFFFTRCLFTIFTGSFSPLVPFNKTDDGLSSSFSIDSLSLRVDECEEDDVDEEFDEQLDEELDEDEFETRPANVLRSSDIVVGHRSLLEDTSLAFMLFLDLICSTASNAKCTTP